MIIEDKSTEVFLALVRAGLWETDVRLSQFNAINYSRVLTLAEEQSIVGLVAAGVEHIADVKVPKEDVLQFVGQSLQIEQRNAAIDEMILELIKKLREANVYVLLVKGQGIAQCYERPLWRTAGDIDFLLSEENYKKAKDYLIPIADEVAEENQSTKHQALVINGIDVELHGKMPFGISKRVDKGIDEVIRDCVYGGNVKSWQNRKITVFMPSQDNHVILVFTHFLHHFFIEGVGLRQICDWCRLLWKYHSELDLDLLEHRIRRMGLMTEWKTFGSLAVDTLGMPKEAMPFYDSRFTVKGGKVLKRVLKCGNFGHNNDLSYRAKYKGLKYKMVAMWRRFWDFASLVPVFPVDAPKFFVNYLFAKVK